MDGNQILLLGLCIEAPWTLMDQHMDTDKTPHELHLEVKAKRGAKYPCPVCGKACSADDFQEKTWRHLVSDHSKPLLPLSGLSEPFFLASLGRSVRIGGAGILHRR